MMDITEKFGEAIGLIDDAAISLLALSHEFKKLNQLARSIELARIIVDISKTRNDLREFSERHFTVRNLISDAALASEIFGDDECEKYAEKEKGGKK